jgi:hypothetical protein
MSSERSDLEASGRIAAAEVHYFSIFDLVKRIDADIYETPIVKRHVLKFYVISVISSHR